MSPEVFLIKYSLSIYSTSQWGFKENIHSLERRGHIIIPISFICSSKLGCIYIYVLYGYGWIGIDRYRFVLTSAK